MIIKKIKLHNIRSYIDSQIEFPQGSIVLAGDIGTGKTSILLAIEFALFGLQPGQRGSSLLRNGTNEGSVSLEIEIDNNTIMLERGLERKKSINQSFSKISINSEEKEMSVTELKNKVLSILQYPKEFAKKTNFLYRFTVYTPQEEMKQIIVESSDTRLNTLRHIFGIDKYKRIRENTQLFTIQLREQMRTHEGQIKDLEDIKRRLTKVKENIDELEKDLLNLVEELKSKRQEGEKAKSELEKVEGKIKEKEKYEREAEKTNIMLIGKKEFAMNIDKEISMLEEEIKEARKIKFSPEEIEEKKEKLKNKEVTEEKLNKSYLELLSKINSSERKISDNGKLKEQISSLDLCPTCLQNVNEEYKKNIMRRLEEDTARQKKEIFNVEQEKQDASKKIGNLQQEISSLKNQIEELNLLKIKFQTVSEKENKILELEKQKNSTNQDIDLLEKQIKRLKESSSLLKKYETIYEQKRNILQELEKKEKEKELELTGRKKEKEMLLKQVEEIEQEIRKKEAIKDNLFKLTELEDWLSSSFLSVVSLTERNIMFKLKEEFSKLFNEWFNILVPEIFTVRLDEDFTPIIEQQDFSLDYTFLSGGERTAIALAYRLALNQVINSMLSKIKTRDLVILDEPTDGFSEQQLDKMRDVLDELKVKQLIIVSHESKIESFVENIIKFRKEGGVTKIE